MRLRTEDLAWQELDGEIVLLDLQGSAYFQLNGSGTLLWRRLVEGCDRPALEAALEEHYDVTPAQAATDVDAFLAELLAHRLLDISVR